MNTEINSNICLNCGSVGKDDDPHHSVRAPLRWGGYYAVLAEDCKEKNITSLDPVFQVLLDLEKTTNFEGMYKVLETISRETQNKLNSPLLDGLILYKEEKQIHMKTFGDNIELVKFLYKRDTKKRLKNNFEAAIRSSVEIVKFFLENFPKFEDEKEQYCYSYVSEMQLETIKYLVKNGVSLIKSPNGNSLIISACNGTNIQAIKWLVEETKKYCIENKIDGNPVHASENEALDNAIFTGNLEIVKYLLEEGAFPESIYYIARAIQPEMTEEMQQIIALFINDKTSLNHLKRLASIVLEEDWFFALEFLTKRLAGGKYAKTPLTEEQILYENSDIDDD